MNKYFKYDLTNSEGNKFVGGGKLDGDWSMQCRHCSFDDTTDIYLIIGSVYSIEIYSSDNFEESRSLYNSLFEIFKNTGSYSSSQCRIYARVWYE